MRYTTLLTTLHIQNIKDCIKSLERTCSAVGGYHKKDFVGRSASVTASFLPRGLVINAGMRAVQVRSEELLT